MKKDEIQLWDWMRIMVGEVPAAFYLELIIRAAFVYFLLMLSMRLMGKRMSTQMSRLEMAAMVSLAAAIGVPMLAPDRGLLPAVIIAAVVVAITRLLSAWAAGNEKVESISQDHLDTLIVDGVLQPHKMKQVRISREQLLAQLRDKALLHTGQVQRLYMEANGSFSLVESKAAQPGLPVLPEWDHEFLAQQLEPAATTICQHCGNPAPHQHLQAPCSNCAADQWGPGMKARNQQ